MAIGLGGRVFGVRGGVRVGTKGVSYGIGAGPLKATGGHGFRSRSGTSADADFASIVVIILVAVFCLIAGIGVVASFIPLAATSLILLIPYRTDRSRNIALAVATLTYFILTRMIWTYIHDNLYVRATDPDSSGTYTGFVVAVMTGWVIGVASASFFALYSVVRGKRFYDKIYVRTVG